MINFYCFTENCHQIRLGNLSIYFSFKVPIGYRIKQDLWISEHSWGPKTEEHIKIITTGHKFVLVEKIRFNYKLEEQFRRTIWDLGKEFTLNRMGINANSKHKRKTKNTGKIPE